MPTFRPITEEELAILNSRNNSIVKKLTPEEKLDRIFISCQKRGIRIQRFHFRAVEHEDKVILFDGNKKEYGKFSSDKKGIGEARRFAVKLFCDAVKENRNGGFKFDCLLVNEFGALKEKENE